MTIPSANGFGKRSINGPLAFIEALVQRAGIHTRSACPLTNRHGSVVVRDVTTVGAVIALFSNGRPSAIVRRVIAVVVNAVDGMFRGWARSHVLIEGIKGIAPTLTNLNAPAAIARVSIYCRIVAAIQHRIPRRVFRLPSIAVNQCVFVVQLQAAATAGVLRFQIIGANGHDATALTFTNPMGARANVPASRNRMTIGDNRQVVVSFANQIVEILGNWSRIVLSHFATSLAFWLGEHWTLARPVFPVSFPLLYHKHIQGEISWFPQGHVVLNFG